MDWCGTSSASDEDLGGRALVYENWLHIVIFADYGAHIDGFRALELDGITPSPENGSVAGRAVLRAVAEQRFVSPTPNQAMQRTAGRLAF